MLPLQSSFYLIFFKNDFHGSSVSIQELLQYLIQTPYTHKIGASVAVASIVRVFAMSLFIYGIQNTALTF